MNAQLEREADARLAAERASDELARERDRLAKSVSETNKVLASLKNAKKTQNLSADIEKMRRQLDEREAEIERLKVRQAELELLRKRAYELQMQIENEMNFKNYKITIPKNKRLIVPMSKYRRVM